MFFFLFFFSLLENSPAVFPDRTRPRTRVRVQTQRITADRRHTYDLRVRHPVARDGKRNEPSPEVSIPVSMMLGWLVGLVKDRMASHGFFTIFGLVEEWVVG